MSCQFILGILEGVNLKVGDRYSKPTKLDHSGIHKILAICADIAQ